MVALILRVSITVTEDISSVPGTHYEYQVTACRFSSRAT